MSYGTNVWDEFVAVCDELQSESRIDKRLARREHEERIPLEFIAMRPTTPAWMAAEAEAIKEGRLIWRWKL